MVPTGIKAKNSNMITDSILLISRADLSPVAIRQQNLIPPVFDFPLTITYAYLKTLLNKSFEPVVQNGDGHALLQCQENKFLR